MKRVNGFLDLDDYFEEVKEKENLGELGLTYKKFVIESDYKEYHYWLKINGEYYYFKALDGMYEELIVSECAHLLGIDAVSYDLATYKGIEGVISKSYRKEGCRYVTLLDILHDYLKKSDNEIYLREMGYLNNEVPTNLEEEFIKAKELNNLEIMWQALEQRYPGRYEDVDNIIHKLVLIFIFNVLVSQNDGEPQNWEIEESVNGINLMPFIDGELCFPNPRFFLQPRGSMATNFNDFNKNNYEHLREFFKVSPTEYIELFLEKFEILTLEKFKDILKQIEKKLTVKIPSETKKRILESFKANRGHIESLLEEMQIRRNGVKLNG